MPPIFQEDFHPVGYDGIAPLTSSTLPGPCDGLGWVRDFPGYARCRGCAECLSSLEILNAIANSVPTDAEVCSVAYLSSRGHHESCGFGWSRMPDYGIKRIVEAYKETVRVTLMDEA